MLALLVLCAGFIVTLAGCEWLRPPGKLQSVLPRIALIQLAGLLTTAVILLAGGRMRPVPIFIFWSGAALAWFGCRSHLESSILLRNGGTCCTARRSRPTSSSRDITHTAGSTNGWQSWFAPDGLARTRAPPAWS